MIRRIGDINIYSNKSFPTLKYSKHGNRGGNRTARNKKEHVKRRQEEEKERD